MNIIAHALHGITIGQREDDGYINATALAKSYEAITGKRRDPKDWVITERAKSYLEHLSLKTGYPVLLLIQVKRGGKNPGTWIHPKLAIPFATWLSVEFEFQVAEWVEQWMTTGAIKQQQTEELQKLRSEGKQTRRELTDAIADYLQRHPELSENTRKWIYTNVSEAVNLQIFGRRTNRLCKELNAHRSEFREALTPKELLLIQEVEDVATRLIDAEDAQPLDAVKAAASRLLIPKQSRCLPRI